jgi:hypothetical protein
VSEIQCVVPEGKTINQLTVAELSWCSKRLGVDVLVAVTEHGHPDRSLALAYVATAWKKRVEPKTEVAEFTGLEFSDLMRALGMGREVEEEPAEAEEIETNPTDSALE